MIEFKYTLDGGNLTSIKVDGVEKQHQPDPRSWMGQDVVIFPFVARLIDQTYTVNGQTYSMDTHGLCRYNKFTLIEDNGNRAILEYSSNEESKKHYPYDFVIRVIYEAIENTLNVTYQVTNKNNTTMPFGIGGHPALIIDKEDGENEESINGNKIVFPNEVDLYHMALEESGRFVKGREYFGKVKEIEISRDFIKKWATLIMDTKDIDYVTLVRKNGEHIRFDIKGIPFCALWTHPQYGDYFCVEPWVSIPDFIGCSKELSEKQTLVLLPKNEEYTFSYQMTFEK